LDPAGRLLDWQQVDEIADRLEAEREAQKQRERRQQAQAELARDLANNNTAVIDGSAAFQRADPWKLRLCAALQPPTPGPATRQAPVRQAEPAPSSERKELTM
jgi:hypothetical protein